MVRTIRQPSAGIAKYLVASILFCAAFCVGLTANAQSKITIDFEDYPLAPNSAVNQVPDFTMGPGFWGNPVQLGEFSFAGAKFSNLYDPPNGYWDGFAISNNTDTVQGGVSNQFSAFPGSGAFGSSNYLISYMASGLSESTAIGDLLFLPTITIDDGFRAGSVYIANTTYTALDIRDGSNFSDAFTQGDKFKLTIFGLDIEGNLMANSIEHVLANYDSIDSNFGNSVSAGWEFVDLTELADAKHLLFQLNSTDISEWGMNTPGYFALDNLTLSAVPEPTSLALLATVAMGYGLRRRMRRN